MAKLFKSLLAMMLLLPVSVMAANAPPRLQVEEKVVINADPAKVWEVVGKFDSLHVWHPAVTATDASGNDKGATRTLTLDGGATIEEKLTDIKNDRMMLKYNITGMSAVGSVDDHGSAHDIPVIPVNKYVAFITVKAVDGGTEVSWKAKFYRAYTGHHDVPAELNDEAATKAVTGVFRGGLDNLKTMLEQ